jgi:hypothetical protein
MEKVVGWERGSCCWEVWNDSDVEYEVELSGVGLLVIRHSKLKCAKVL